MTAPTPTNDLVALLAERDRVEAWLLALEGKRDSTPAAVFQKVQRDYSTRLEALTGQLRERDRDLELRVAKLADELTSVEVVQRARQDTRAEAELRHLVGEYTEEQWTAVARESDAELAAIETRRTEFAREHQAALDLLGSVRRPTATPAGAAPRTVTQAAAAAPVAARPSVPVPRASTPAAGLPQVPRATPAAGAPAAPSVPRAATPAAGMPVLPPARPTATPAQPAPVVARSESGQHIKTPSLDELAFLSSLAADVARRSGTSKAITDAQVSAAAALSAPAPAPAPAQRASRPVTVAETKAAEAAPRKSRPVEAAEVAVRPPAVPPSAPATEQDHLDAGVPPEHAALTDADVNVPRGSHTFATPGSAPDPRATSPRVTSRDSASILRRAQAEHVKSLKCVECGTLNLPTEWYCEKCGAELSTL